MDGYRTRFKYVMKTIAVSSIIVMAAWAFIPPIHHSVAFTIPTHPHNPVAFGMPTHPVILAFGAPWHP